MTTATKRILFFGALLVALGGWYWFRPERAFIDVVVHEPRPGDADSILRSGSFRPLAHEGRGRGQLIRIGDGQRILRLTEFRTLNGPDVRVYLVGGDARDSDQLQSVGFVDLGPLKGNVGDQNYAVPASVEIGRFKGVAIWCRRFGVNFAMASFETPTTE
jgi:hypothetical protein